MSAFPVSCIFIFTTAGYDKKKERSHRYVGRAGRAATNLLCFEVRKANKPLDPLNFFLSKM